MKDKDMAKNPMGTTAPQETPGLDRSEIHVALGRGRTGKTTWARWAIERAERAGRSITTADGDRNNASLTSFYPNCERPAAADEPTVTAWLERLTADLVDRRARMVLDMGGGDRMFANVASHHDFNSILPENGVDLVAWYFLSGGRDDFETVVFMENLGFKPPRTVIVLNHGLAPPVAAGEDPFAAALESKSVRSVIDRGAKVVRMPATPLKTMVEADGLYIGIRAAMERKVPTDEHGNPLVGGPRPLDLWRSTELKRWLEAMEKAHVDAGVADWLP